MTKFHRKAYFFTQSMQEQNLRNLVETIVDGKVIYPVAYRPINDYHRQTIHRAIADYLKLVTQYYQKKFENEGAIVEHTYNNRTFNVIARTPRECMTAKNMFRNIFESMVVIGMKVGDYNNKEL